MPFVQDSKNGAAASLGSIKDRIKNFEFMKESGSTSPRALSPIQPNNENATTVRRTGVSWERPDGSERRQMRRSERREAELRRENEILAFKAKEKSVIQRDKDSLTTESSCVIKTSPQAAEKQASRVAPRVTPRVSPRENDRKPETTIRRRRNENKEPLNSTEVSTQASLSVQNSVSVEKSPSNETSSSNETIDINSFEETANVSSEDIEENKEKKSFEEYKQVDDVGNEEETEEDEEYDVEEEEGESERENEGGSDEESEGVEKNNESEEDEKQQDDDEDKIETEQGIEEAETEEEQDNDEEKENEMQLKPPTKHHTPPINEQPKPRRDKIANYTNTRKTSKQHHGDGDDNKSVLETEVHDSQHQDDTKNKEPERRGSSHTKKKKQHQRQSSVSGNESGELKNSRHRKEKLTNAPEAANEMKTKQHRRKGSNASNDLAKLQEERSQKTCDGSTKKSECPSEKSKKDESQHASSERKKSVAKGARRSSSRNSLKSVPVEVLGDRTKDLTEKQTGSKSKQATSDTPSGLNSRKTSIAEDETSEQPKNVNEVSSLSNQLNIYSHNVFGLTPGGVQASVDAESEGTSSPDLKHDEHPSKKAFVCAIHEESCKYYCQDCERLICSECAMRWGDCHEHYYLRVKDAWKKYREEMLKILQEARSSVSCIQQDILENSKERDSFKLKVESTIKKINSFFDEHVQALEKRRINFLETVEEIMKFREIGINQEIDNLQNNLVETNSTINIAGRVYGTSTMMEFLQVCQQLTNRLLELGHKKIKLNITESIDIDFISEPNLFEQIEKVGQLKKHKDSTRLCSYGSGLSGPRENIPENHGEVKMNAAVTGKAEEIEQDSMESVIETSAENLSESTSAKNANDMQRKPISTNAEQSVQPSGAIKSLPKVDDQTDSLAEHKMKGETGGRIKMSNEELVTGKYFGQQARLGVNEKPVIKPVTTTDQNLRSAASRVKEITNHETSECFCALSDDVEPKNGLPNEVRRMTAIEIPMKQKPVVKQQHDRRHSMDDVLGMRSKKDEIQRRLGSIGRYRPPKSVAQFLDEGERYFSSGEAEQRRRKQEYYKVRFNDRAYYSNPSDSSELEEMRGYDFVERPVKHKVRRHRTMPLIRPISERRELKSPWSLDVFRYHGKIHFTRNSLKATGKAFGWNAVVGCQGFSQGKHSWKVRVTKWTAVGVCYKDDHVNNPSWGAGNKWTWDSADMCYSPRLGVCESPVGEWIDGDVIALELDCDNSVLIVHNLRTSETDKLYGFKEPVYPYFYLSVFRSISLVEIDGVQVSS